ncbi:MAG TPA: hypothetical protein VFX49_06910 [Chloroflexota bacterium]|nr:hypothetical protein [Chloroflexota bacterium]
MTLTAPRPTPSPAPRSALAAWRAGVRVARVSDVETRHAIHAYYTATPESPVGRHVVFYASTTPEAHAGALHLVDRATGESRLLVDGLCTEDSHRAACQQWVLGGTHVVYHDVLGAEERWVVCSVDVLSGERRVLAEDVQLAWGQPDAGVVPVYGPHWDPNAHRDLDLLDVRTGERRTVLTADEVRAAYPDLIAEEFGDRPVSIFFPALSPDLGKVFFKMASPLGGHFRSKEASHRALLVCYSLAERRFLFADKKWGHPAWHPNSEAILDVPNVLIDANTGARRALERVPRFPGSHPSFNHDGSLYATDVALDRIESGPLAGAKGEWGIVIVDVATQEWALVDRFDESRGATSWRRCHPHPVFSPDGSRLYYTASDSEWSRLRVAEPAQAE